MDGALSALTSPLKWIGDALSSLGQAIGKGFDSMVGWLQSVDKAIADFFGLTEDVYNSVLGFFSDLISWINPFSDDFILKVAFVPSEGYFENYSADLKNLISEKFAVVTQIRDTITALNTSINNNVLGNDFSVSIDLSKYGIGKQEIVSMAALNYYGEKVKFWLSGFIYFLVAMWLYRKFSSVLGVGK